jgi:hypothetical protein
VLQYLFPIRSFPWTAARTFVGGGCHIICTYTVFNLGYLLTHTVYTQFYYCTVMVAGKDYLPVPVEVSRGFPRIKVFTRTRDFPAANFSAEFVNIAYIMFALGA